MRIRKATFCFEHQTPTVTCGCAKFDTVYCKYCGTETVIVANSYFCWSCVYSKRALEGM